MKKPIIFIKLCLLTFFLISNIKAVKGQKLSKEEKQQKKEEFLTLCDNFPSVNISEYLNEKTSEKDLDKYKGYYYALKFVKKSTSYSNEIKNINEFDFLKNLKMFSVLRQKKKFYAFLNYGNWYNHKKILDVYEFIYNDTKYLLLECMSEENLRAFNLITESSFVKYNERLELGIIAFNRIKNKKFVSTISIDTINKSVEVGDDKYTKVDPYYSEFRMFVRSMDVYSENPGIQELGYSVHNSDFYIDIESSPRNIKYEWDKVTFELDSIKLYKFNEEKFYRYIFSQDQTDDYMSAKYSYDKSLVLRSDISDLSYDDLNKMSKKEYWEAFIPEDTSFVRNFLVIDYISPRYEIMINDKNRIKENEILFYKNIIDIDLQGEYESSNSSEKLFKFHNHEINLIRRICVEGLWLSCIDRLDEINKNDKERKEKEKFQKDLIKKFGKKYVEEAQNGNIVVGMPEELLSIPLRVWNIKSSNQWERGYRIFCSYKFDISKKLIVYVYDGKVRSLSTW